MKIKIGLSTSPTGNKRKLIKYSKKLRQDEDLREDEHRKEGIDDHFLWKADDGAHKGDRNGEHAEEHDRTWKMVQETCGEQESSQSTSPR